MGVLSVERRPVKHTTHGVRNATNQLMFTGASAHDVEELAMQGVKPWDDDASAVMTVLNGGY